MCVNPEPHSALCTRPWYIMGRDYKWMCSPHISCKWMGSGMAIQIDGNSVHMRLGWKALQWGASCATFQLQQLKPSHRTLHVTRKSASC